METGQGRPRVFRARVLAASSQHTACIPAQYIRPTREEGEWETERMIWQLNTLDAGRISPRCKESMGADYLYPVLGAGN